MVALALDEALAIRLSRANDPTHTPGPGIAPGLSYETPEDILAQTYADLAARSVN